jgi:hypothetical protein
VSSSFCFHFVWFRFGAMSAPDHHNHSLALGPIFGVRLTASRAGPECIEGAIAADADDRGGGELVIS